MRPLELTDLLWGCDPVSGARVPVRLDGVLAALEVTGASAATCPVLLVEPLAGRRQPDPAVAPA